MSTGKIVGDQRYRIECPIAKGAFSTVYRCLDLQTGHVHAIKVINKALVESNFMHDAIIREINAMVAAPQSKYLINLIEKLASSRNYYLIMDLAEGGSLLDFIQEFRLDASSHWARRFFLDLLRGLHTLHRANVVHRDIKPENLLLNKRRTRLIISDFGFACCAPVGRCLHRACGTLRYCAPELLVENPNYDGRKVDVWAAGVTLYFMLFLSHPFQARRGDYEGLAQSILSGKFSFPRYVSPALEHLFSVMLEPDPERRWGVSELLRHAWVLGVDDIVVSMPRPDPFSAIGSPLEDVTVCGTPTRSYLVCPSLARGLKGARRPPDAEPDSYMGLSLRHCRSCPVLPTEPAGDELSEDGSGHSGGGHSSRCSSRCSSSISRCGSDRSMNSASCSRGYSSASAVAGAMLWSPTGTDTSHDVANASSANGSELGNAAGFNSSASSMHSSDGSTGPGSGRRDFLLTLRVAVNFFLFCVALVTAGLLRFLFDADVSRLPIPAVVREALGELLVPPHERRRREETRWMGGAALRRSIAAAERAIRHSAFGRRVLPATERPPRPARALAPLQMPELSRAALTPADAPPTPHLVVDGPRRRRRTSELRGSSVSAARTTGRRQRLQLYDVPSSGAREEQGAPWRREGPNGKESINGRERGHVGAHAGIKAAPQ